MRPLITRTRTGRFFRDSTYWLVLLLVLVVLVPTVWALWLLNQASRNERLAVRQQLTDSYQSHLSAVKDAFQSEWQQGIQRVNQIVQGQSASAAFRTVCYEGFADSLIVMDANGGILYPSQPVSPVEPVSNDGAEDWKSAEAEEFVHGNMALAAERYHEIAVRSTSTHQAARALQAEARCRLRAQQHDRAIHILSVLLQEERYAQAVDPAGRWIAADADLRVLQIADPESRPFAEAQDRLLARLNRYDAMLPHSSQRLFLMREYLHLQNDTARIPTLQAEQLAADWASNHPTVPVSSGTSQFAPNLWQTPLPDAAGIVMHREQTLVDMIEHIIRAHPLPKHTVAMVVPPGRQPTDPTSPALTTALSPNFPDWRLAIVPSGDRTVDAAADQRRRSYWLTAALMLATTSCLAFLLASTLQRQLRLAHLKNDLVATVSHELKTPLSSMRLLVDTLRDRGENDPLMMREYLELIAKENARLTRLIDNFLTFSRLERGKQTLTRLSINPGEAVERAVATVRERWNTSEAAFVVQTEPELPTICVDPDALATILINLLDNAIKYTGAEKRIEVTTKASHDTIRISVHDNGIGLDPRAARRVFDRFYQVDSKLSRATEGCGLGLSIVRSLVQAHGGQVAVASHPGKGSTFTVVLPVAATTADTQQGMVR